MQERESEIVYAASSAQMESLPRVLRNLASVVRAKPLRLFRDRYLDTPSLFLMRSGVTCRLRRFGKRDMLAIQSLKPFRDGLADHAELCEDLHPQDWVWPGVLPGSAVRNRLFPLTHRLDVVCLFAVKHERRVYDVWTRDGARLDVSMDRTRLAGSSRGSVLYGVAIELRTGSVESLNRFASDLRRRLKLKLAKESEFDFGMREAGLAVPVLDEGPALRIRARDSVRQAAARALTRHFRRMLWHEPGTRLGINPECLHDMRVSVRRLRAILRLFCDHLPPVSTAKLSAELKWMGQSLGAVRDLDVHLQGCSEMQRLMPEAERKAAGTCRSEMVRRRDRAYENLRRDLRSHRFKTMRKAYRELIRRLRRPMAAGGGTIEVEGRSLIGAELRRILKAGRTITAETPSEILHRLRIRCKRLRYACESLSDLYGKPAAKLARRLAALQDALGAYQDAVAAQTLIEHALAENTATPACGFDAANALRNCAAIWREEHSVRRAVFPKAWNAFDRKKLGRTFLKSN